MRRTVNPPAPSSARARSSAPLCSPALSTMPTITGSSPRDRNASPSAHVMITGNANTQNTASGSRRNSRNRASVSSTSGLYGLGLGSPWGEGGLLIAQVLSGQRHEHVFERGAVGAQLAQRRLPAVQQVEQ